MSVLEPKNISGCLQMARYATCLAHLLIRWPIFVIQLFLSSHLCSQLVSLLLLLNSDSDTLPQSLLQFFYFLSLVAVCSLLLHTSGLRQRFKNKIAKTEPKSERMVGILQQSQFSCHRIDREIKSKNVKHSNSFLGSVEPKLLVQKKNKLPA
jgi:hypothetical protein